MNRFLFWLCVALWVAVIIWAGVVFYFSSLSGADLEQMDFGVWDKAAHFLTFLLGGALLSAALVYTRRWTVWKTITVATLTLSLYGALDEWHQLHAPGRFGADKMDWLADTLGAFCGAFAFLILYGRIPKRGNQGACSRN